MGSHRLTRRALVKGAAASTVGVAATLGTAGQASAGTDDSTTAAGYFVRATGARSGVVSLVGEGPIDVTLDPEAFVVHGADGVVRSLTTFVPGEEVAVRGPRTGGGIVALEFQSVYTAVIGTLAGTGADRSLNTPSGRVRVPAAVASRDVPADARSGSTWHATVWVHPVTSETSVVGLRKAA